MALSLESCACSCVCWGLVMTGDRVTISAGLVGESNEVELVVVLLVVVTVVVQFGRVPALLLVEAGGL